MHLYAVVAQHLLLVPHPHAVLEFEVERLQELKIYEDSLFGRDFMQFARGRDPELLALPHHVEGGDDLVSGLLHDVGVLVSIISNVAYPNLDDSLLDMR